MLEWVKALSAYGAVYSNLIQYNKGYSLTAPGLDSNITKDKDLSIFNKVLSLFLQVSKSFLPSFHSQKLINIHWSNLEPFNLKADKILWIKNR